MEKNAGEHICLGMFTEHSPYAWAWNENKKIYYRECSLSGCSFSETATSLKPLGRTMIADEMTGHAHDFSPWKCTADQMGNYIPPWQYKRSCRVCHATQMAEDLMIGTQSAT